MEFLIFYLGIGLIFVIYSIHPINLDSVVTKCKESYKKSTNNDFWPFSDKITKVIVIISIIIGYILVMCFWPIYLLRICY